jgi:hypothetical protein
MRKLASLAKVSLAVFAAAGATGAETLEEHCLRQLLAVGRVYVDRLGGGDTAPQMRDMIISSLQNARLFLMTDKEERADAILRGSAEDLVFNELHQISDGVNARAGITAGRSTRSLPGMNLSVGEQESQRTSERKHEAIAAVRLINKDGDVIWATTQESFGAKFRGSAADVAEKIVQQLNEDFDKARKLPRQ